MLEHGPRGHRAAAGARGARLRPGRPARGRAQPRRRARRGAPASAGQPDHRSGHDRARRRLRRTASHHESAASPLRSRASTPSSSGPGASTTSCSRAARCPTATRPRAPRALDALTRCNLPAWERASPGQATPAGRSAASLWALRGADGGRGRGRPRAARLALAAYAPQGKAIYGSSLLIEAGVLGDYRSGSARGSPPSPGARARAARAGARRVPGLVGAALRDLRLRRAGALLPRVPLATWGATRSGWASRCAAPCATGSPRGAGRG